jgi:hypothetical protein
MYISHKTLDTKMYDKSEYGSRFIVCTAKQDGGEEKADDEEGRKERGMKRRRRKCGEK